ncbi:hypothetical protein Q1W73_16390 [Asticcacaulis sp. ZE23SCel15]|uniref:hypothetical protein n=1 Tax=Asticcacaulis sp. ZE23SCel15 TaxID=3059027 RepID=UPI00265FCABB|nr:hypothetical protein [Asticcacaulis sp. ZE23SCel15]WKL57222.1 hypothetical protein Q1W73_16390 [Asticcacaulis sp. ZE23SCel15]
MPRAVFIDSERRVLKYITFYDDDRRDEKTIWQCLKVRNYTTRPIMNYDISAPGVIFTIEPNSYFRKGQMIGEFRLNGHLIKGPAIIAGANPRNKLTDSPTLEQIKRLIS